MTSNLNSPYGGDKIHVNSYVKRDGTEVRAHERSRNGNMCYPYDYKQGDSNPYAFPAKYQGSNQAEAEKFYKEKALVNFVPKQFGVHSLVNTAANMGIYGAGWAYSKYYNLSDSWELFKVGSVDHGYNPEYVQKNGVMHNSLNDLGDEKLAKSIKARLYWEGTGMDDCRVFDMHENSSLSQNIAQSAEMKDLLKKGLPMLRYSGYLPSKKITFDTPDLYNTLHGANIEGAQFDKDGNLYIKLGDLYNFDKNATSMRSMVGYKLQSEGKIKPYYLRMTVKIPKTELDKY